MSVRILVHQLLQSVATARVWGLGDRELEHNPSETGSDDAGLASTLAIRFEVSLIFLLYQEHLMLSGALLYLEIRPFIIDRPSPRRVSATFELPFFLLWTIPLHSPLSEAATRSNIN